MELNRSQNLDAQKEKILRFIEINGPSLPVHISSHLKLDSLLASAFLSDLLSDKELKMSSMRVGNSPIYFIQGQEFQLEKFANYLPAKEREAFNLLINYSVLKDDLMLPAIRVALRSIKDFSFPFEYNGELYWRYIKFNDQQAFEMIESGKINFSQLPKAYQIRKIEDVPREIIKTEFEIKPEIKIEQIKEEIKEIKPVIIEPVKIIKKRAKSKPKGLYEFVLNVNKYLQKENISIVHEIKKDKKEYMAVVGVDKGDGNRTEYLCIAKEKKSISDKELMKQLHLGQKKNLPVLFITSGEASKKAVEWLDYLGNVIVYKKME